MFLSLKLIWTYIVCCFAIDYCFFKINDVPSVLENKEILEFLDIFPRTFSHTTYLQSFKGNPSNYLPNFSLFFSGMPKFHRFHFLLLHTRSTLKVSFIVKILQTKASQSFKLSKSLFQTSRSFVCMWIHTLVKLRHFPVLLAPEAPSTWC